jgi:hypothetical protein
MGNPLDFSDLGAQQVSAVPPAGAAPTGGLDFSDLGAKSISSAPIEAQSAQPQQPIGSISAVHEPNSWAGKAQRWADNVSNDIKYGTDLTGIGSVLKKMGAHGVYSGNPEAVGDFMASLPLGLLKAGKGSSEVAQGKMWQGTKDIVSGGLQASTMPASFVSPEISELTAEKGAAAAGTAARTSRTAVNAVREEAAQPELQSGIRKVAAKVADEAGVARPKNPSMYKTVEDAANNVLAKSKGQYKQLDQASGGRWQRFDDQLRNIRQKMSEVAGIDDDKYSELELKQNELETLQENLIDELKSVGKIDPKLADQAVGHYRQAQSLYDLDTAIQRSTSGKPVGVGTKGLPEVVDVKKLAPRVTALWKSGRLQQALGEDNATDLMDFVGEAAKHVQRAVLYKTLLKIAGIGTVGVGAATHLFSGGHLVPVE